MGVGFSYSNTPSDYNTGDNQTADSNYIALTMWLALFPEYKGRAIWITGESYSGDFGSYGAISLVPVIIVTADSFRR